MKRRGFTLFEMAIASTLLAVMAGIVVQAVGLTARQRRASDAQHLALHEAANLVEQIVTLPWNDLTPQRAQAILDQHEPMPELEDGSWEVQVVDEPGEPPARRVTVSYQRPAGSSAPVRLTAWAYEAQR